MHRVIRRAVGRTATVSPQGLYRGLYVRIARKLGVDPSYVSRVARGQRRSAIVEKTLRRELDEIARTLGRFGPKGPSRAGSKRVLRLPQILKRESDWIRREWLRECHLDPVLRRVPISAQQRINPILPLVQEALKLSLSPPRAAPGSLKSAVAHARLRRRQGYSVTALLEEYNLLRRCISSVAERHFHQMDHTLFFRDLGRVDEAVGRQMQSALNNFLSLA